MWLQEAWMQAKEGQKIKYSCCGAYQEITKSRDTKLYIKITSDTSLLSDQWEIVKEKKKVELKWRYGNSEIIINFVYLPETAKIYAEWEE